MRPEKQQPDCACWSQTRSAETFHRVDHTPCPDQNFCDTNANARSVCGS